MAVPLTPGWRAFYESAQQQNVIDPALVTAVAISESGWSANGGQSGPVNLGIDSNGTPGLPGTPSGVGNATHRFYTYSNGLQAAQGLAAYLRTPLYGGTDVLGMGPERMLDNMVRHGYSGCNANRGGGGECDPNWDFKILQLRSNVIAAFGLPSVQQPTPGQIGGIVTPVQSGGSAGEGPPPSDVAGAVTGAVQGATAGLDAAKQSLGTLLGTLTRPGFWWGVLLFGGALLAIVVGVLIYFRGNLVAEVSRA
jgi:hypothetical protein